MKGITWTQVAQYAVLIVAYLIPAFAISNYLTDIPVPQAAFTFSDIIPRLNTAHTSLGFAEYTAPFANKSHLDVLCTTLALMVGTAGLPHVIVRFYTVPSVRAARYSAGWALLFIALLYTTAPALAAFARLNLLDSLHGKSLEEIQRLDWVRSWQSTNLLAFTDKNGDSLLTVGPGPAFLMNGKTPLFDQPDTTNHNEVYFDPDIVVLSTPEVAGLAPWVIALVAAGGLAAALSTASGLLLVISSSIAHDIYFRLVNPHADEAHRVFVGRIMVVASILVAGYFGINPPGFVGEVVAFAFGLAAASFFPIIILGIFTTRTNREGAICGMLSGLIFTTTYIIGCQFFGMKPWLFGISAQGIGTIGMLLNFAVTSIVSRLTAPPPAEIRQLVESLSIPAHPGPAVILDEGTE